MRVKENDLVIKVGAKMRYHYSEGDVLDDFAKDQVRERMRNGEKFPGWVTDQITNVSSTNGNTTGMKDLDQFIEGQREWLSNFRKQIGMTK